VSGFSTTLPLNPSAVPYSLPPPARGNREVMRRHSPNHQAAQPGYHEAKDFAGSTCPPGSQVLLVEDDAQTEGGTA